MEERVIGKRVAAASEEKIAVVYDKVKFLEILFNEIEDEEIPSECYEGYPGEKYVTLKNTENILHWRIVSLTQLVKKKLFPKFGTQYREFLSRSEHIIFMFNMIGKKPVAVVMRSIKDKEFYDISLGSNIVYGLGELPDDFEYGDKLFLTEGLFDKEVASVYLERYRNETGDRIYPIGILTSSVTNKKAELLSHVTNNFILNPDNDKAGENSISTSKKRLVSYSSDNIMEVARNLERIGSLEIKDMGDCYPMNEIVYNHIKSQLS